MELTEEQLIERARTGDEAAFGFLVDKYKGAVHALAYRKLGDYHEAEDITQEAFLRAYQNLSTLRDVRNFAGWLYVITANCCGMHWRKKRQKLNATVPLEDITDEQWDTLFAVKHTDLKERQSIQNAIATLPECDRTAITLYYMGGMSIKEIARFLGASAGAIKNRLYRARKRLKEELVEMMEREFAAHKLDAGFTFNLMETLRSLKPVAPAEPTSNITRAIPLSIATAVTIITVGLGLLGGLMPQFEMRWQFEPSFSESEKHIQVALIPSPVSNSDASRRQYRTPRVMLVKTKVPSHMENAQHLSPGAIQTSGPTDSSILTMQPQKEDVNAMASIEEETEGKITVFGKVVKGGAPVKDAQIYRRDRNANRVEQVSTTRADGSFQFEMPEPSGKKWWALTILAYHPQYSLGWKNLSKEEDAKSITIELHNAEVITGTVTETLGKPIAGAAVQIGWFNSPNIGQILGWLTSPIGQIYEGASPDFIAKTDKHGNFVFRNLPEDAKVSINILGTGYAQKTRHGIQAGTEGIEVTLKREGRIEGQVTFSDTDKPAKNVVLYAQGLHPTDGSGEASTDETGRYVFTNLPSGNYNVFLGDIPDWTAIAREYVQVAEGQTTRNVDVTLVKGGFITGRVTDKDTGEPIPNCDLGVHDAARPESQAAMHSASTNENGYYRFRAAPGQAKVYASYSTPEGYIQNDQEKYVYVVEGETVSEVDFQCQKGVDLTGTVVTFDGKPVVGIEINDAQEWFRTYATSDKDGKFTIRGLRPGQKLSLNAKGEKWRLRGRVEIEAQPGAEVELLLEEYETTSVVGRVVDSTGKPVSGANIHLTKWDREVQRGIGTTAAVTGSDGKFEIDGLIVGDEYRVSVDAEEYRRAGTEMFIAEEDMPPFEDIVLQKLGSRYLEGRITDTDGNAVTGARVVVSDDKIATTDAEGHYRLDNLEAAVEIGINIYHKDYGHSRFRYIPTNQTHNFVIVKADRFLAGRVVDADGNPLQEAPVGVDSDDDEPSGHVNVVANTNAQGEFRLGYLLDDSVDLYVRSGRLHQIFPGVETDRDDVVLALKGEEKSPSFPKPLSEEEISRREYQMRAHEKLRCLKGKPALELEVEGWLNCAPVKLAELKGEVVVLAFWTSRDVRCVEATRLMNALQQEYGPKGVVCIGIHEFPARVDELKKFIKDKGITYKMAVDKQSPQIGAYGMTFDKYAVWNFRPFIVMDKKGILHTDVWDHALEEQIKKLLSE